MYFYVPDLKEYMRHLGCFVDYKKEMPGPLCYNEDELVEVTPNNIRLRKKYLSELDRKRAYRAKNSASE